MTQPSIEQKIGEISARLNRKQTQIADILPEEITFSTFKTQILIMLRNSTDVLDCTPDSIVAAAIDSALDGLRCDGKEAAIVKRNVNIGTRSDPNWQAVAHYMPMAHGIRKKIIQSGAAVFVEAHVVYKRDFFRITQGTDARVDHEPFVDGDRGDMRGVYAVAILPTGHKVHEYMSWPEVMDVKAASDYAKVWDRWPGEMARKSVLRRFAKALIGESQFVDMEMKRIVQAIEGTARPVEPEAVKPLPPRPTREALEDHSSDMQWNDFSGGTREREAVCREDEQHNPETGEVLRADEPRQDTSAKEPVEAAQAALIEIPGDDAEWDLWAGSVTKRVKAAKGNVDQLKQVRQENAAIIAAAPDDIRNEISTLIDESIVDATSNGDDNEQAESS